MAKDKNAFICPICGRKSTEYRHGMTKTLVSCMWHLNCAGGRARLDKMGLGNSQFTNFQKLQYWGLAVSAGGRRAEWILTAAGTEFLQGRRAVAKAVFTLNALVKRKSEELVFIHEVKDCVEYKLDWQEQARQPGLFD